MNPRTICFATLLLFSLLFEYSCTKDDIPGENQKPVSLTGKIKSIRNQRYDSTGAIYWSTEYFTYDDSGRLSEYFHGDYDTSTILTWSKSEYLPGQTITVIFDYYGRRLEYYEFYHEAGVVDSTADDIGNLQAYTHNSKKLITQIRTYDENKLFSTFDISYDVNDNPVFLKSTFTDGAITPVYTKNEFYDTPNPLFGQEYYEFYDQPLSTKHLLKKSFSSLDPSYFSSAFFTSYTYTFDTQNRVATMKETKTFTPNNYLIYTYTYY